MFPRIAGESGGSADAGRGAGRAAALLFVVAALAVLLVPFLGMAWAPTTSTAENRELAAVPALLAEDGSFNERYLQDWGAWFDDHFAYRDALVTGNARLRAAAGVSATDQVIVGSGGWLYYAGTLADYQGTSPMSERALANAARNLALVQQHVEARGAVFAFCAAPDKNELYAQDMPAWYLPREGEGDLARLQSWLDAYGVRSVDLAELLRRADGDRPLYCLRDTHWNNRGALLAGNALLAAVGAPRLDAAADAWTERDDFTGDLARMLFPASPGTEPNSYLAGVNDGPGFTGSSWELAQGGSVEDSTIVTRAAAPAVEGALVMYRDSFGNALIPYLSTQFATARYSKLVPYNLDLADDARPAAVIVERAQRHLPYLAEHAPIMESPELEDAPEGTPVALAGAPDVAYAGPYVQLAAALDVDPSAPPAYNHLYAEYTGPDGERHVVEAYPVSLPDAGTDYGMSVCIRADRIDAETAELRVTMR